MRDANRIKEKIELHLDRRQVTSLTVIVLLLSAAIFALGVMVGKNLNPALKAQPPSPEALLKRLDAMGSVPDAGIVPDNLTFQEELTRRNVPALRPLPSSHPMIKAKPTVPAPIAMAAEPVRIAAVDAGTAPVPAPGVPASFFTVQIKATQSSAEADKFAEKLRGQGLHPSVVTVDIPGKGRWYRVRVGKFDSHAQALRYLEDFQRETHLQAFVTAAGH